jgi:hypothetical protein
MYDLYRQCQITIGSEVTARDAFSSGKMYNEWKFDDGTWIKLGIYETSVRVKL